MFQDNGDASFLSPLMTENSTVLFDAVGDLIDLIDERRQANLDISIFLQHILDSVIHDICGFVS